MQLFLQFEYMDWLADECGAPRTEEWRKKMFFYNINNYITNPQTFRDAWTDEDLVLESQEAEAGMAPVATLDRQV